MTENFVQSMLPLCLSELCVSVELDSGKRKLTIFIHILVYCFSKVLVHACNHHRDWEMVPDPFIIRHRFQSQDYIVQVRLRHHIRSFHPVECLCTLNDQQAGLYVTLLYFCCRNPLHCAALVVHLSIASSFI